LTVRIRAISAIGLVKYGDSNRAVMDSSCAGGVAFTIIIIIITEQTNKKIEDRIFFFFQKN
jgi:hypothetical protein